MNRTFCLFSLLMQVWEPRTGRLVSDFKEHLYGVQSCALSPDNSWVISADIDSVIIVSAIRDNAGVI